MIQEDFNHKEHRLSRCSYGTINNKLYDDHHEQREDLIIEGKGGGGRGGGGRGGGVGKGGGGAGKGGGGAGKGGGGRGGAGKGGGGRGGAGKGCGCRGRGRGGTVHHRPWWPGRYHRHRPLYYTTQYVPTGAYGCGCWDGVLDSDDDGVPCCYGSDNPNAGKCRNYFGNTVMIDGCSYEGFEHGHDHCDGGYDSCVPNDADTFVGVL